VADLNTKVYEANIEDFLDDPNNANKGTERGNYMMGESVEKTGLHRGIFTDKHGVIVGGNKTRQAAADKGFKKAIVVETDGDTLVVTKRTDFDLSDPSNPARLAAYVDNRTSQVNLDFDFGIIKTDIDAGLDLSGFWFDWELEGLTEPPSTGSQDAEPQTNRADELQKVWQVEPGQLWRLPSRTAGQEHRLICGDCTDRAVVERVMSGDVPILMIADPPYGIEHKNDAIPTYNHKEHEGIANDSRDAETFARKFVDASGWLRGTFYIFGAYVQFSVWYPLLNQWRKVNQVLVWVKDNSVLSRLHYNLQFELIYNGYTSEGVWNGDNTQNDVLTYRNVNSFGYVKDDGSRNAVNDAQSHPHQKPLDLIADLIKLSSNGGQVIYDPFAGSGTTIIAAENLSRQCRAIEISPAYCAVILQRYCDAFGIRGELVG